MKLRNLPLCRAVLLTSLTIYAWADDTEPRRHEAEAAVRAVITEYVAAFNQRETAVLAALWMEQGVYVDERTEERLVGRDAIQRDLELLFRESGDLSLGGRVDAVRFIRPDVAEVSGQVVTSRPGQQPNDSLFTAILVRDGERWFIDSVHEELLPRGADAYKQLQALEFLVGRWVDVRDAAPVHTTFRWGANRTFLVRSYSVDRADGSLHQGTQVIGWDPRDGRIRSWMFDSDGSFGEGTWSREEENWIVKIRQTLSDGRVAGGTQVITRVDDDTFTVKSIGCEVEGDALPASEPVRVVRVNDAAQE